MYGNSMKGLALAGVGLLLVGCLDQAMTPTSPPEEVLLARSPNAAQHTTANVYTHPSQGLPIMQIQGAEASLVSNKNGIRVQFRTAGLTPGHAYTLWFAVLNAPEQCLGGLFGGLMVTCTPPDILGRTAITLANVAYAAGHVVGGSGKATFANHFSAGPIPGGWYANELTNPMGADVHLIVMDHGPAIPGLVSNQISSLRGGCTDASVPAAFPPVAHADGIPGPNTCRLVQFAVLEQ